ncbi:MAG: hypothetical protein RLY14_3510 [Planctomycetota bacterium]|jgi:hypothetical protein
MAMLNPESVNHHRFDRRCAVQAGAIGLLGLGMNHLLGLRAFGAEAPKNDGSPGAGSRSTTSFGRAKSCIFIFLSGGLSQHESFDPKPNAPEDVRGEFKSIPTALPGVHFTEHLPRLAQRTSLFSICRTLTHASNDHSASHHIMLTGRTMMPVGFDPNTPSMKDHPSIASIVGGIKQPINNLPPAVILPEKLIHSTGRIIPGQGAGAMGRNREPWFIEASPFHSQAYGAFPQYTFDHQQRGMADQRNYQAPQLQLQNGLELSRVDQRLSLLKDLQQQARGLEAAVSHYGLDNLRQRVVSLLADSKIHHALNVTQGDDALQDKYGRNSFGWSLLMARKLIEAGVQLVQVNLGNDETWDTHGNAFPHLKDKLLPPTDVAISALLDDLSASGLLDETLVVVASEFGRTPKITLLPQHYKLPGRDHWGALQSVLLAGGGVTSGICLGKSDSIGGYPIDRPVTPEQFAATIYHCLGIPAESTWEDAEGRPHNIYYGEPIAELMS